MFAVFQFGHAQMVNSVLKGACRDASRFGATEGITTQQVRDRVRQIVGTTIDPDKANILIKDASNFEQDENLPQTESDYKAMPDIEVANAQRRQLILVRVSVAYNDIALSSLPFMHGAVLTGQAFTRHE
jgi:hypothetical protein